MFKLSRKGYCVKASGVSARVQAATARDLGAGVAALFEAAEKSVKGEASNPVPAIVVGALPFLEDAEPYLYQPQAAEWGAVPDTAATPSLLNNTISSPAPAWRVTGTATVPSEGDYARMVRLALARMGDRSEPALHKVVLARAMELSVEGEIDPETLLQRMAIDPIVSAFQLDMEEYSGIAGHRFVGATPELLVARHGLSVSSHPLAGSAARQKDSAADEASAKALLQSEKDIREHSFVVEAIMDTLAPLCTALSAPDGMALLATNTLWHLGTRIEGTLKEEGAPSAAALAALLNPTPAVGGYPRQPALDFIRAIETQDRGFYAGAVGWVDASGDGEWYVALRCADIQPSRVILNAGAGIVLGSDPEAEVRETGVKFGAMLSAFGA